jgi:hypothetical protein
LRENLSTESSKRNQAGKLGGASGFKELRVIMKNLTYLLLSLGCFGLLTVGQALTPVEPGRVSPDYYPYQGERFRLLVDDSFQTRGKGEAKDFYLWMDKAFRDYQAKQPGGRQLILKDWLREQTGNLGKIASSDKKSEAEIALAAGLHKMIKAVIPHFSLERGFEFHNVIAYGERQCFLQAVLIAGLLQEAGVEAGVVMVYRNIQGATSNNGHAVTLVKLPDGNDLVVDASEPEPFPRHQGLFAKTSDYIYLTPIYAGSSPRIVAYQTGAGGRRLACRQVKTLDFAFLRSQFYYYRGERAPGGILAKKPTPAGLKASLQALRTAVTLCPENPLAVYMLGRVCYAQGDYRPARSYLARAQGLYARFGWVPQGVEQYRALAAAAGP